MIVVPVVFTLVLLALGYYRFLYRKEGKNHHDILKESCNVETNTFFVYHQWSISLSQIFEESILFVVVGHGHDISNLESLQFELAIIEVATNRFATENMIGKGGFGEVYKVNMLTSTILKR